MHVHGNRASYFVLSYVAQDSRHATTEAAKLYTFISIEVKGNSVSRGSWSISQTRPRLAASYYVHMLYYTVEGQLSEHVGTEPCPKLNIP